MNIELTEDQYKDLVELVILGSWIREDVARNRDEAGVERWDRILQRILFASIDQDIKGMAEIYKDVIIPTEELMQKIEEIDEGYREDNFWEDLINRLGQRDYFRDETEEDKEYSKKHYGMFPEKVHRYYKKYEKEFEKHGLSRLEVKE